MTAIQESDCDYLYHLQCIEGISTYAINPHKPEYSDHVQWFFSKIQDPSSELYLMKDTDENIGVIRLDKKLDAEGNDAAEISLTIDPKYAGKGYEKRGITFIIAGSEERLFQAVTHKDSMSSRKVFVANGFVYRANHQDSFDLFVFEKVSTK